MLRSSSLKLKMSLDSPLLGCLRYRVRMQKSACMKLAELESIFDIWMPYVISGPYSCVYPPVLGIAYSQA